MALKKTTISLQPDELAWIAARAERAHEGNVSAAVGEAVRALRQREGLEAFLRMEKARRLTPAEVAEVFAEIQGAPSKPRRRRPRAA
jgi:hypothetical protein